MCEKSQLAGIRLQTPQFIILIRLLVFSTIPHIHKGVKVRGSTTHAELTLRKSRWWLSSTYSHSKKIPMRTSSEAACTIRPLIWCDLSAWWMRLVSPSICLLSQITAHVLGFSAHCLSNANIAYCVGICASEWEVFHFRKSEKHFPSYHYTSVNGKIGVCASVWWCVILVENPSSQSQHLNLWSFE